jgi:hypothetical protein
VIVEFAIQQKQLISIDKFYPDNCKLSNVLSGIANAAQRGEIILLR